MSSPEPSVPLPGYQVDLACSLQFDAHEQAEISALVHRAGSVMHCLLSPPSSNPSPARHVVTPFEQVRSSQERKDYIYLIVISDDQIRVLLFYYLIGYKVKLTIYVQ